MSPSEAELKELKESLQDTQPVGALANCAKTLDQVRLKQVCARLWVRLLAPCHSHEIVVPQQDLYLCICILIC